MPVVMPRHTGPEQVAWRIGGIPVNMDWESARMTAPGGYENMRGRITGIRQARQLIQGAEVVGVRPSGRVLYKGLLASQPKIVNNVATIEAEGFQGMIRRRNQRLPYILSGAEYWSAENESPFDYAQVEKFQLQGRHDGLGWIISKNENYTAGERAGYALYVPERDVQAVKFTLRKTGNSTNFDLDIRQGDDLGALSTSASRSLASGGPADGEIVNFTSVNKNTVSLTISCNTSGSPASSNRVTLTKLHVMVIADNDAWATSDVASDVASRMGFADAVTAAGTEIGALDWTGSWDELLDYMAAIEDWTWLVEEDRTKGVKKDAMLSFQPWGRKTWMTNLDMAEESLTVAPLYNRVTVRYERPAGVPQHKSFTPSDFNDITDPIANGRVYEYPDGPVMEDPQRDTDHVDAIGERLLRRVTQLRLVGNIKVAGLDRGHPFDIKAGDKLKVSGYNPDAPAQRVSAITYNSDGTADVSLERSYNIAAMLFRLTAHRRHTTPHKWGSGHRS